jgi:hypothetical protein
MRVPGTIDKHSPEHQKHVCRFLDIPVVEYEDWLAGYNLILWRRFHHFLIELRDKIDKSLKSNQPLSITLEEAMRLYGIEDGTLTSPQQKLLVESTNGMLEKHDLNWFLENHELLKASLELAFSKL